MKTFLIAALTLDGFIAQNVGQSSLEWTSAHDKKRFVEITKRAGVVVMGQTTFKTIGKALKDRRTIVYSPQPIDVAGIETTTLPPAELLQKLATEGHAEVAICGGASIYTMFAKAGHIDTMYLTKEPVLFGSGIKLFTEDIPLRLELKEETRIDNTLLLEYTVKK